MKETNELILFIVKIERRGERERERGEREREREKVCIYSAIIIINYWFYLIGTSSRVCGASVQSLATALALALVTQ